MVDGKYKLPDDILKAKHGTQEYWLQVYFVDYLRGRKRINNKTYHINRPFPDLFDEIGEQRWTHIASSRDSTEGFFLQNMGFRAGVLDLLFWSPRIFFMDAKIPGNDYTKPQNNFCGHMKRIGIPTFKFHTVAEGRDILIRQGLRCENNLVSEPPATKEAQQLAYLEAMKPIVLDD